MHLHYRKQLAHGCTFETEPSYFHIVGPEACSVMPIDPTAATVIAINMMKVLGQSPGFRTWNMQSVKLVNLYSIGDVPNLSSKTLTSQATKSWKGFYNF